MALLSTSVYHNKPFERDPNSIRLACCWDGFILAQMAHILWLACLWVLVGCQDTTRVKQTAPGTATAQATVAVPASVESSVRAVVAAELVVSPSSLTLDATLTDIHPAATDDSVAAIIGALEGHWQINVPDDAFEEIAGGHHSLAGVLPVQQIIAVVERARPAARVP